MLVLRCETNCAAAKESTVLGLPLNTSHWDSRVTIVSLLFVLLLKTSNNFSVCQLLFVFHVTLPLFLMVSVVSEQRREGTEQPGTAQRTQTAVAGVVKAALPVVWSRNRVFRGSQSILVAVFPHSLPPCSGCPPHMCKNPSNTHTYSTHLHRPSSRKLVGRQ